MAASSSSPPTHSKLADILPLQLSELLGDDIAKRILGTPEYAFQELVRTMVATLVDLKDDKDRAYSGQLARDVIVALMSMPPYVRQKDGGAILNAKFVEDRIKPIQDASPDGNIRRLIKSFYMWPFDSYPPWTPIKPRRDDGSEVDVTQVSPHANRFVMELHQNRIRAKCVPDKGHPALPAALFDVCGESLKRLVPGVAPSWNEGHITTINSPFCSHVIEKHGSEVVEKLIRDFNVSQGGDGRPFAIEIRGIKATRSLDWEMFSTCFVVDLASDVIDSFVKLFNDRFAADYDGRPAKPSLHLTFATLNRSFMFQPKKSL